MFTIHFIVNKYLEKEAIYPTPQKLFNNLFRVGGKDFKKCPLKTRLTKKHKITQMVTKTLLCGQNCARPKCKNAKTRSGGNFS